MLLKTDRRLEISLESRNKSFQDAATAGAQLTMIATFISTTLYTARQCFVEEIDSNARAICLHQHIRS